MGCQGQHLEGVPSKALRWPPAAGHQQQLWGWGDVATGLTLAEEAATLPAPPQKRLHF